MDVAVIEGEVGHTGVLAGSGIEEFFLDRFCTLEDWNLLVAGLEHGAVGGLGPVEVIGEAVGSLIEIDDGLGIVIADDAGEESGSEEGRALGWVGLIGIVDGPEVGLVFGDATAAVDDVASDEDVVGLLLGGVECDFTLAFGVGGAIAEDYEAGSFFCRLAGDRGRFEDDFAVSRDAVGEALAGFEVGQSSGVDTVGRGAGEVDAADLFGGGV